MTLEEFAAQFNPNIKQYVFYKRPNDEDTNRGLLISEVWISTAGHPCVNVRNFITAIRLEHVHSLEDTKEPW